MLNTIARKIGVGYIAVVFVLIISGVLVYWETRELSEINHKLREFRRPTVETSMSLLNGINESQSAIRGWLIRGEEKYLDYLNKTWNEDIEKSLARLTELSEEFQDPVTIEHFNKVKSMVGELRANQDALAKTKVQRTSLPAEAEQRLGALDLRHSLEVIIASQHKIMEQETAAQAALINNLNLLQVVLILIGILTCILMAVIVTRAVTRPIAQTIDFADAIATGDYHRKIEISGSVEIERLKVSLEKMCAYLEKQDWLNKALLNFNATIRGVDNLTELARSALNALARVAKIDVGLLYLNEGDKLKVCGGYAHPHEFGGGKTIELGEGVAGQAAASRKLISLSANNGQSLSIPTLVGNVKPSQVAAVPLVYGDNLVGVMELASTEPLRDRDEELLAAVSETMAITMASVEKSDQVRNLLHETQTQAEELQAQQEELRVSNDELQARQEELESINEELEEQKAEIDQKNHELEAAQRDLSVRADELERVGKYKSEFLANMSHELRTPLNSQLILSRILSENKEGNLSDKQVQFAQTIHQTGLDLLQLINDILDLAKVEAGKLSLHIQSVEVSEITGALERDFSPTAEERNLKFRVETAKDIPNQIVTDSHRLLQILRNFLSNAFKFTEEGEISVRLARVNEGPRQGHIAISVKDTGIGIPQEKHELIFQAFEQVDSATTRQYGGTGLGLAISTQLASLLGGEIKMASSLGQGSEFTLIIPESLSADAVRHEPRQSVVQDVKPQRVQALQHPARVLLVDDDKLLQEQITSMLEEIKIATVTVPTAEAGLRLLDQGEEFDCLILDIRLPDMLGFEFLRKIKKEGEFKSLPVIVYTAMDLSRKQEEELRSGSEAIIIKGMKSSERLLDEVSLFVQRIVRASEKTAVREEARRQFQFQAQKVLVVDDDIRNIFSLTSALEEQGLSIVIARDGQEALEVLDKTPDVRLVLMDVMMPVMDGYEATRRIKADPRLKHLPVIALTAKAMKEDKELCLAAGANDYLPKPVDLDRLFAILKVWIAS